MIGDLDDDTPEARFERAGPAERARMVEEHHDNTVYWGWCQKCGTRVEGLLKNLRGEPCPKCGHK